MSRRHRLRPARVAAAGGELDEMMMHAEGACDLDRPKRRMRDRVSPDVVRRGGDDEDVGDGHSPKDFAHPSEDIDEATAALNPAGDWTMGVLHRMPGMGGSSESTGVLPQPKLKPKLIVLWAFDRGEDGELRPAFEAREMPDERRAVTGARELSHHHAGSSLGSREANIAEGDYGPSEVLFQHGAIPDLD